MAGQMGSGDPETGSKMGGSLMTSPDGGPSRGRGRILVKGGAGARSHNGEDGEENLITSRGHVRVTIIRTAPAGDGDRQLAQTSQE